MLCEPHVDAMPHTVYGSARPFVAKDLWENHFGSASSDLDNLTRTHSPSGFAGKEIRKIATLVSFIIPAPVILVVCHMKVNHEQPSVDILAPTAVNTFGMFH